MDNKKLMYIIGVVSVIYFIIVTSVIFKKPDGWSYMPASWQAAWSPNYGLYILLLAIGAAGAWFGYKVFKKKEQ